MRGGSHETSFTRHHTTRYLESPALTSPHECSPGGLSPDLAPVSQRGKIGGMTAQALLPLQGLAGLLPGTRGEPEGDAVLFVPVERPAFRWADLQRGPGAG